MHLLTVLAVLATAASPVVSSSYQSLLDLARQGNGLITLNEHSYSLLTDPKRTWSASVQLTALDSRRKCAPCK